MAVFDLTQKVVSDSSGIIAGNTRVNEIGLSMLEASLMQMDVGPLFGLFLQSFFIGITMRILSIVIFVIVYGRMIEIYCMVSLAPIPMATWGNHEQSHMGQNYLKCLFALGFQGFLILICVAMMKIKKFGALLVSAVLCIGMAAPAFAYEGDTTPVEEPVLPEIVEEEDAVTITDEETGALTPEGNLTLVDDYHTNYSDGSGQQFITMVSKSGATFYLVIDRNAKGQQTVHFMNLVDEADLLALMEEEAAEAYNAEKEAAKQAELDKLKAEEEAKKAAEEAAASDAEQPKENKVTKYAAAFLGVVALIALVAGGGFYFFIQQKHKKQAEKEAADPDADYTEDNGNFEIPPEDDSNDEDTSEEQDVTPI